MCKYFRVPFKHPVGAYDLEVKAFFMHKNCSHSVGGGICKNFLLFSSPSAPRPVENNNAELGGLSPVDEEHVYTKTHDAYPGIYELPRRVPAKRS